MKFKLKILIRITLIIQLLLTLFIFTGYYSYKIKISEMKEKNLPLNLNDYLQRYYPRIKESENALLTLFQAEINYNYPGPNSILRNEDLFFFMPHILKQFTMKLTNFSVIIKKP